MDLTLSVVGDDSGRDARALLDWLRRDNDLRGQVTLYSTAPSADEMGLGGDVVAVAFGPEGAFAALAAALSVWLRSRTRDVTVRISGKRGSVEVDVRRTPDAEAILKAVRDLLNEVD
jgi:hypothetical protein